MKPSTVVCSARPAKLASLTLVLLSVFALGASNERNVRLSYFDRELLQLVAEQSGNVLVSPASVKSTLGLLWEGAVGTTAEEIRAALRLSGSQDRQRSQLHKFQSALQTHSPRSQLEVASQIFFSEKVEPKPSYVKALTSYGANFKKVNMAEPEATADIVNTWVKEATHGLVPNLVEPGSLSEDSLMVLANAVYFRGTWLQEFEKDSTRNACFYTNFHDCKYVPMMEAVGNFSNRDLPELEAIMVELPYDDHRFSMVLILPDRRDGLAQLARDLPQWTLFRDLMEEEVEYSEILVSLPRFSIEYQTDLVPMLSKLKLSEVFSPRANLSSMVEGDLKPSVSNVFHKARIEVNEAGATAGAASGAVVVPLMGGPPKRFQADHPFLFFIRDKLSGGFLFAGRVEQPEEVSQPAKDNEALQPTVPTSSAIPASPSASAAPAESIVPFNTAVPSEPVDVDAPITPKSQTTSRPDNVSFPDPKKAQAGKVQ